MKRKICKPLLWITFPKCCMFSTYFSKTNRICEKNCQWIILLLDPQGLARLWQAAHFWINLLSRNNFSQALVKTSNYTLMYHHIVAETNHIIWSLLLVSLISNKNRKFPSSELSGPKFKRPIFCDYMFCCCILFVFLLLVLFF